ncbi:MAG: TrkH family potassium uptake protein, partial [Paracoccus sp. (in: a-proteobacteria)]|nr:TrkH family potassium uptake protein [Paracoccus sp. (in: a-proteobacteria)]
MFVTVTAVAAAMMMIPAAHASVTGHSGIARNFFYASLLTLIFCGLIGFATLANPRRLAAREMLLNLVAFFTLLPLVLAVPFAESIGDTGWFNAWWEMVSSLTTTGASLYSADLLPDP